MLSVVVAAALGILLPLLDERVDSDLPSGVRRVLFSGDADAARTVLDAIASSLITVTSLTFSLTVVTLQLASSQFSPRLLRTFTSDVFVQATLGLFLATFTFSLTVLRSVRSSETTLDVFIPRIAVTTSFVLAIISVIGLVVFLAHLARQIRVETMLANVHSDATDTIAMMLPDVPSSTPHPMPDPPERAERIYAKSSGFMVRVDHKDLIGCAVEHDLIVRLDRFPGSSVIAGTPIGYVWSREDGSEGSPVDKISAAVDDAMKIGPERTATHDIGYGLRQLSDVAIKALSPGINDPTTAVYAISHLSSLLSTLATRDLGPQIMRDDNGEVRAIMLRPTLRDFVESTITQPRRYGATDPDVAKRLYELLGELAWHIGPADEDVVQSHLARLTNTVYESDFDSAEVQILADAADDVRAVLTQRFGTARSTT